MNKALRPTPIILLSVSKLDRDEYFTVKKMFSTPDECIRKAMYAPFQLDNPTGEVLINLTLITLYKVT